MASRDLINLGISPDSGTGDSARRGGEKINNLFADVYTQFGDNPVGQDPNQPFYGYRRPFFEYEYKVGELHPAGRFIPIEFKTTNSHDRIYDSEWGYGYDSTGNLIDTDGDGIPDIYRDSEWYFLSRGEKIDADFTQIDSDSNVHFVLPIGVPGDQIIIRDGYGTWNNTLTNKGIHVNFWTTPFEFQTVEQIQEWEQNTGIPATDLDSDVLGIRDPLAGSSFSSNWHKVKVPAAIGTLYPRLDQPFATSRSTDPYNGLSKSYVVNQRRYQYEFLFSNYQEGWVFRQVALDAADVAATLLQFGNRLDAVDSDLDKGLYVSADSDIRHTVPIFRRTNDGREIHGTLALRGDNDAIMTTIDSEDTAMINDPRAANGGDTVQPLTTTIRFKLRDNVKVKDNLFVGNDLEVGRHLQVGETLTIDSDLAYFNNRLQVHEKATFDSDVLISGELDVTQQARFASSVRIDGNLFVAGDSTVIETESLRVSDNLITLSKDADGAPITDTGIIFQRFDNTNGVNTPLIASDTVYNPFIVWNEQTDTFRFGETVSSDSEQNLTAARTYATLGRGLFTLNDSENAPRVIFEKASPGDFPDDVRGTGAALGNPNERPTVEPDYAFHVKANAVFGRDSDDVVVFNSRVMSNFVPFGDERYNLGDSDNKWKDLYLAGNTIYLGSIKLKDEGGVLYIADSDDNRIDLTGADFTTDNLTVDSDVVIGGNSALLGELTVQGHARFDSDVDVTGKVIIGQTLEVKDDLRVAGHARFDSDVTIAGTLNISNLNIESKLTVGDFARFDSDVSIAGNLRVGQNAAFEDDIRVAGNAQFDSDVTIAGTLNIANLDVESKLTVGDFARFDSDISVAGKVSTDVIQGQTTNTVTIDDKLIVNGRAIFDSDVVIGNDLRVDSDVIIKGTMSVGQEAYFHDDVTFYDNAWFDSDVIITGNLTVNGTTTYVNTTNLEVADNFIVLNKNQASPFNDTGIIFQRFDSDSVSAVSFNPVFEWDEADDKFIIGETDGSGITPNPGITASYAQFYSNGNVQFFEDTGATPKFHWDASNERLGLGTDAPITKFEIDNGTDDKYIQLIQGSNGKYIAFGVENDTAYVTAGTAGAASSRELAFQVAPASGVEYEVGRFNSAGSWLIGGDTVASAKFAFDMSGNSDPGGEPVGGATNRPTLTGDGVIDGGTF